MEPSEMGKVHVSAKAASNAANLPVEHASAPRDAYASYLRRKRIALAVLACVFLVLVFVSLCVGSSNLTLGEILAGLFAPAANPDAALIVWDLRMPHVLCAVIAGVALAASGCAFQSVLNNPLASASTLGVSQGAAFGACVGIVCLGAGSVSLYGGYTGESFTDPWLVALCAFAGALVATGVVLALSRFREMTPESIVLAGVALSAFFAGAAALIQYFADESQVASVVFWTFGSLRRAGYPELALMAGVTAVTLVFFFLNRWTYNAFESGEASAHNLGVSVKTQRVTNMLVGTVAASIAVAFCGTINFVGLIAPHIMRRFVGSDYRYLLPASILAGACLLLAADLLAQVVPGAILPIGALTSLVGAPLFVWLLLKGMHH